MRTLKLEVEDSKFEIVLNIIQNLKDDVITRYEVINEDKEHTDFMSISKESFEKVWDNQEDEIYDKYL